MRRADAAGRRKAAFFAAAVAATSVPHVAAATVLPPREYTVGPRTRLSFASGLEQVSDRDFRLLFRMTREDFLALRAGVAHRLAVDDGMATLSSGSPIPTDCRLALGLRMLAGASYLDIMLAFGVGRCTVYSIFHQV